MRNSKGFKTEFAKKMRTPGTNSQGKRIVELENGLRSCGIVRRFRKFPLVLGKKSYEKCQVIRAMRRSAEEPPSMSAIPTFTHLPLWLVLLCCVWLSTPLRAAQTQMLSDDAVAVVSHLTPAGRLSASRHLHLAISLPLRNQQALTDLLRQLQNPASPNYHKYLTPAQFAERFGPTEKDYEAVADFAKAHGLTVTARRPNRVILDVDGAVSDIEKTLHVTMRTYQHPSEPRQFYAPDAEPTVADLPVSILHISGLNDYSLPHSNLHLKPAGQGAQATPDTGSGTSGAYGGGDFRAAYVPGTALTGSGQSVGLLEYDGYYASDITAYELQFGLPAIPLVNVSVDGGITTPGSGDDEVSLDIEMAISMAPGLSAIYVYEAPNDFSPWVDILDRIADDDLASQISCSWAGGTTGDPTAEQIFQQMAAQGQSFFQACGDSDAYTGAIPFPADSPNISVVGGTELTTSGPGGSYVSETVWNQGTGIQYPDGLGTGGGISPTYPIPPWQQAVSMSSNQGSTTMRNIPDVAMTAYNIEVDYNDGSEGTFVGTSCAAPLWAAFTALVNQQAMANGQAAAGFINPAIYAIGTGAGYETEFNDITTGNNFNPASPAKFSAVTGYDLCTGWGTPAGTALINALAGAGPADPLQVSYSRFITSGTTGGPFAPASGTYALTNTGAQSLQWTASATQSWLSLSATAGVISASGSATLAATINAGGNGLAAGIYSATITFTDVGTGVNQARPVTLIVTQSGPILLLIGATPFASSGLAGGPFSPSSATYLVANAGNAPMTWSVSNTTGWLTASPAGGTLAAGGTTSVTASITPAANSLPLGDYSDTLSFTNLTNGGGNFPVPATLAVLPPAPVISSGTTAVATQGQAFSYQIGATNTPTSYNATGLPSGLAINTATGVISGTASGFGLSDVAISASNAGGTGSATLALTVTASLPVINSGATAAALVNYPFAYQITAANAPFPDEVTAPGAAISFNATGLPPGLSVNTASGVISGTPTAIGTSDVTISATNPAGTASTTLVLTISQTPTLATTFYIYSSSSAIVGGGESGLYPGLLLDTLGTANSLELRVPRPIKTVNGWQAYLAAPGSQSLVSGTYTGATRWPSEVSTAPGLELEYVAPMGQVGSGRNVTNLTGSFIVLSATYSGSQVTSFAADFIQYDNGITGEWNVGCIRYNTLVPVTYPTPPAVSGLSASGTTTSSVVVNATVNPDGLPATCYIQYGPTTAYGYSTSMQPIAAALIGTPQSVTLTGLQSGATYHYQWVVANGAGTSIGPDSVFTTLAPPAITSASSATGISGAAFNYRIAATNAPASYNATGLPAGLGVNTASGLISGTATAAGTSKVAISASNAVGTGTASLAIVIDASFAAWQALWFTPAQLANPAITGDTASPAGDGVPNLLKYALNLNPMVDGVSGLPVGSMMAIGGNDFLTLTYTQILLATDITYIPEVSGDMQTWNSGLLYVAPVSVTPNPDGVTATVVVQDLTPAGPASPRFIRLRITGP